MASALARRADRLFVSIEGWLPGWVGRPGGRSGFPSRATSRSSVGAVGAGGPRAVARTGTLGRALRHVRPRRSRGISCRRSSDCPARLRRLGSFYSAAERERSRRGCPGIGSSRLVSCPADAVAARLERRRRWRSSPSRTGSARAGPARWLPWPSGSPSSPPGHLTDSVWRRGASRSLLRRSRGARAASAWSFWRTRSGARRSGSAVAALYAGLLARTDTGDLARGAGARARSDSHEACADHRDHRAGRQLPGGASALEGLRGPRNGPSLLERELRAHRPPPRPRPAPPGRPAGPVLAGVAARRRPSRTRSTTSPRSPSSRPAGASRCSPASSPRSA